MPPWPGHPFSMVSSSKVLPSFLPAHSYSHRDPGLRTRCTTSPPQAVNMGARLSPTSPAPAPPPGGSWGSPGEHGEAVCPSKQMAPAPSLSSAALLLPGGTMAFCLPSCGLWGSQGTAWHWGTQATARMGCVGWREVRVGMSPEGCSLQPPCLGWRGKSLWETL